MRVWVRHEATAVAAQTDESLHLVCRVADWRAEVCIVWVRREAAAMTAGRGGDDGRRLLQGCARHPLP